MTFHTLTARENQVLLLILNEFSSARIAEELQLSIRTVETHRKNIARKTAAHGLVGLTKYAIRAGLVENFHFSKAPAGIPNTTYPKNTEAY